MWLADSIFVCNSRGTFFQDIRFSQNHKGNYGALCKAKKSTHQWTKFFANSKKPYFGGIWGGFFSPKWIFFRKIRLCHCFIFKAPQPYMSFHKNPISRIWEKKMIADWMTDVLTDSGDFIGLLFTWNRGSKKPCNRLN